ERLRFLLRLLENAPEPARRGKLHVAAHLRLAPELGREGGRELRRLQSERGQDAGHDAARLIDERRREMLDVQLRVALVARLLLRGDERFLRFFSELVRIDHEYVPSICLEQMAPDVLPAA